MIMLLRNKYSFIIAAFLISILGLFFFAINNVQKPREKSPSAPLITLPQDAGDHDANVEWWYLNSHLEDRFSGKQYAISIGLKRMGVRPWGNEKVILGITDEQNNQFAFIVKEGELKSQSGKMDLIFSNELDGILIEWAQVNPKSSNMEIKISLPGFDAHFTTTAVGQPLLVNNGIIDVTDKVKSYYYTWPRSMVRAEINGIFNDINFEHLSLDGIAWFDHQWFNRPRNDLVGIDDIPPDYEWFSIILDNDSEMVFWQDFRNDAPMAKYMAYLKKDDTRLDITDFTIEPLDFWQAPNGKIYAKSWLLKSNIENINLEITTAIDNQLIEGIINLGGKPNYFIYYEGASIITGQIADGPVEGKGFVELAHTYND